MSQIFEMTDSSNRRDGLAAAASALSTGRLVVMPTDTVYGLAANAFEPHAVALLLTAKGRGRSMPPPVLIHRPEALDGLGTDISEQTRSLIEAFWPGGLTIIVHQQPSVNLDLGDCQGTVAVRMPDDDVALDLLAFTGPLAVSSANRTGAAAAETVMNAHEQLAESVDVYLDAGPRDAGLSSTIVDATGERLRVVREGALSLERLREVVPSILGMGEEAEESEISQDPASQAPASEDPVLEDPTSEDPAPEPARPEAEGVLGDPGTGQVNLEESSPQAPSQK